MKGKTAFEKMTNISNRFLEEAAFIPEMPGERPPHRERRETVWTRFMDSGWSVALLCAVVSLAAVVAMVQWGRMAPPSPPVGSVGEDTTRAEEITSTETLPDTEEDSTAAKTESTTEPEETIEPMDGPVYFSSMSFAYEGCAYLEPQQVPGGGYETYEPGTRWITDYNQWRNFFGGWREYSYVDQLLELLVTFNEKFFSDRALLVVITEPVLEAYQCLMTDMTIGEERITVTLRADVSNQTKGGSSYRRNHIIVIPVERVHVGDSVDVEVQENWVGTKEPPAEGLLGESVGVHDVSCQNTYLSYTSGDALVGRPSDLVGYPYNTWMSHIDYPSYTVLNSLDEWRAFYTGRTDSMDSLTDGPFDVGIRAIDETFFDDQAMLVLFLMAPSGSIRYQFDGVVREEGHLTVKLYYPDYGLGTADLAYWVIMVPIDKTDAEGAFDVKTRRVSEEAD